MNFMTMFRTRITNASLVREDSDPDASTFSITGDNTLLYSVVNTNLVLDLEVQT